VAIDDAVLRGTAWLSFALWALSQWIESAEPPRRERARASFAGGAVALVVHTALALHLRHAWSQEHALREIARQTAEVTGVAFGGGLLVNYAFLVFWLAIVAWRWRAGSPLGGSAPATRWAIRAVFLFMFLNAGVVFVQGPLRLLGVLLAFVVMASWYRGRAREGTRT